MARNILQIPWHEVDRLLVNGENAVDAVTRAKMKQYPSYSQVAKHFGCSKSYISAYSSKHRCMERRRAKGMPKAEQRMNGKRPLTSEDMLEIADDYIRSLRDNIRQGSMRADSAGDIDKALRLKEFLEGRADSRTEVQGQFTLAMLQEAHARYRDQIINMTPESGGTADCDPYEEDDDSPAKATADDGVLPGQLSMFSRENEAKTPEQTPDDAGDRRA